MSETPETPMDLTTRLQAVQFEWVVNSNRWIIPTKSLEELADFEVVVTELIRISISSPVERDVIRRYASKIRQLQKKLFALMLLCCGKDNEKCFTAITKLVDDGITDADLPFERVSGYTGLFDVKLCVKGHAGCQTENCRCKIKAVNAWPWTDIDFFSSYQWRVMSPVFKKPIDDIPHLDLQDNIPMPYREDFEGTKSMLQGGYSKVWKVRMCEGHQDLYQSINGKNEEPLIAIKRLNSSDEGEFKSETTMHKALSKPAHNYLVELLATYKHKGSYHLLFPYADANLRSFWTKNAALGCNPTTQFWVLDQMTGLASALDAIHSFKSNMAFDGEIGNPGLTRFKHFDGRNVEVEPGEARFGRHGDLKAENILWYDEGQSAKPSGILRITDLGLGHFHGQESRSRQDPNKIGGSPTYIPPEIDLNRLVSRKYDIWSLGCVYLEFVTWLLEGADGLEKFAERRLERVSKRVTDDLFYSLLPGRTDAEIRPGVREWINHLRQSAQCSDTIRELLNLLETRLLVVNSDARIPAKDLYLKLSEMIRIDPEMRRLKELSQHRQTTK